MDNKLNNIIPENRKGSKTDTSHSEQYGTRDEAVLVFRIAKQKLLNISQWHTYAGAGTADFKLTDANGAEVDRWAMEGDHFKINIPGPGSKSGDGYDWVQIQSIEENTDYHTDSEFIAIKVRPATNPQNNESDTAHFFKDDASSTFMINREGLTVSAEVHGRNEQANTETDSIIDKARNIMVAFGAFLGFSELQWKALVKGLIQNT